MSRSGKNGNKAIDRYLTSDHNKQSSLTSIHSNSILSKNFVLDMHPSSPNVAMYRPNAWTSWFSSEKRYNTVKCPLYEENMWKVSKNIVFNTPLPSIHFIWSNNSFDWNNDRKRAPLFFFLQVPTEANNYLEVYIISFQVIIHVIFYFEKQNKTMNKKKNKKKIKNQKTRENGKYWYTKKISFLFICAALNGDKNIFL